MKANEFVKKFGLEDAKTTSNPKHETIDNDLHYCTGIKDYTDGFDDYEPCPDCVNIIDLKRLVESHELVELTGGLEMAKSVLDIEINAKHYEYDASKVTQLSKAIADVESCQ